ncbi:hypothetical protein CCH79_00015526 [Gambusia affinis]|uniref:Uncharacterized protein n=1 Tax=Gambusia affinis TaxID=33528 RepID=A0A315WW76_GAMAF|nr:hypothetical protein CCH79_00015526 [Gambusia affinis]
MFVSPPGEPLLVTSHLHHDSSSPPSPPPHVYPFPVDTLVHMEDVHRMIRAVMALSFSPLVGKLLLYQTNNLQVWTCSQKKSWHRSTASAHSALRGANISSLLLVAALQPPPGRQTLSALSVLLTFPENKNKEMSRCASAARTRRPLMAREAGGTQLMQSSRGRQGQAPTAFVTLQHSHSPVLQAPASVTRFCGCTLTTCLDMVQRRFHRNIQDQFWHVGRGRRKSGHSVTSDDLSQLGLQLIDSIIPLSGPTLKSVIGWPLTHSVIIRRRSDAKSPSHRGAKYGGEAEKRLRAPNNNNNTATALSWDIFTDSALYCGVWKPRPLHVSVLRTIAEVVRVFSSTRQRYARVCADT